MRGLTAEGDSWSSAGPACWARERRERFLEGKEEGCRGGSKGEEDEGDLRFWGMAKGGEMGIAEREIGFMYDLEDGVDDVSTFW